MICFDLNATTPIAPKGEAMLLCPDDEWEGFRATSLPVNREGRLGFVDWENTAEEVKAMLDEERTVKPLQG